LSKSGSSRNLQCLDGNTTVNAASKGHLPVVLYLLTKQSADPLIRNNWGETAYDVAAAVFEVWICEVCGFPSGRRDFLFNSAIGSSKSRSGTMASYYCVIRSFSCAHDSPSDLIRESTTRHTVEDVGRVRWSTQVLCVGFGQTRAPSTFRANAAKT
jgi:hypothetical protein